MMKPIKRIQMDEIFIQHVLSCKLLRSLTMFTTNSPSWFQRQCVNQNRYTLKTIAWYYSMLSVFRRTHIGLLFISKKLCIICQPGEMGDIDYITDIW